jgi:hypothetical protein
VKRLSNREKCDLYVHITRAIDKDNVVMTFGDVQNQVVRRAMLKAQLL